MSSAQAVPTAATSTSAGSAAPGGSLAGILDGLACIDPGAVFLQDGDGRDVWSGRPPRTLTRAGAAAAVRDLSSRLIGLKLPLGTSVGICLPGGSEACLSILAAGRAGLVPVLLPVFLGEQALETLVDLADVRAVISQTRVGSLRPAATFCAIAGRRFRLRFLLAFGPDVPDGVVDLDRASSGQIEERVPAAAARAGIVTFDDGDGAPQPVFRPESSWLAAAALVLDVTRWRAGDTIVSCLAPDDFKGLVTGLVAALLSGAACESQGLFDPDHVATSLARGRRRHLVVPGWTEPLVTSLAFARGAESVLFVHTSMADVPKSRASGEPRFIDAVAFGEADPTMSFTVL